MENAIIEAKLLKNDGLLESVVKFMPVSNKCGLNSGKVKAIFLKDDRFLKLQLSGSDEQYSGLSQIVWTRLDSNSVASSFQKFPFSIRNFFGEFGATGIW
jgi:hypothetical protein